MDAKALKGSEPLTSLSVTTLPKPSATSASRKPEDGLASRLAASLPVSKREGRRRQRRSRRYSPATDASAADPDQIDPSNPLTCAAGGTNQSYATRAGNRKMKAVTNVSRPTSTSAFRVTVKATVRE